MFVPNDHAAMIRKWKAQLLASQYNALMARTPWTLRNKIAIEIKKRESK